MKKVLVTRGFILESRMPRITSCGYSGKKNAWIFLDVNGVRFVAKASQTLVKKLIKHSS